MDDDQDMDASKVSFESSNPRKSELRSHKNLTIATDLSYPITVVAVAIGCHRLGYMPATTSGLYTLVDQYDAG